MLLDLVKKGYTVPTFFLVPGSFYKLYHQTHSTQRHIFAKHESDMNVAQIKIISKIEKFVASKIQHHNTIRTWAVRSSGSFEDGKKHSFAGLFESFLNINSQQLTQKILEIYSSVHSEPVLMYFNKFNLSMDLFEMNIIVQEFIHGDFSGVAFSIDPTISSYLGVSAIYGIGASLLSGKLTGDYYRISRVDPDKIDPIQVGRITSIEKPGNIGIELLKNTIKERVLSDSQIQELRLLILQLEQELNFTIDLEFIYANHVLYILQVRPISVLPPMGFKSRTFDNSNIIESYKGVTTPLTYSVSKRAYAVVYYEFLKAVGVDQTVLANHNSIFDNLLAYIHGQIYYNLDSWHSGLKLLPAYRYNKKFMDEMMGVHQSYDDQLKLNGTLVEADVNLNWLGRNITRRFINFKLGLNIYRLHRTREREAKKFMENFNNKMDFLNHFDINTLSLDELLMIDDYIYENISKKWLAPILNDFCLMIYYGTFRSINNKWLTIPRHNEMLAGNFGIMSTEPTKRLMELTEVLRNSSSGINLENTSNSELHQYLEENINSEASELFSEFIKKFGDRTFDELKLETLNLEDSPDYVFDMIRYYSLRDSLSYNEMKEHQIATRLEINKSVMQDLSLVKRKIYNRFLKLTRNAILDREEMRFVRTKIFGLARKLFSRVGEVLFENEVLEHPRDIFYLTIEEIRGYMTGTIYTWDLKKLVEVRKAEYIENFSVDLPSRFTTFGAVPFDLQHLFTNISKGEELVDPLENSLVGIGCYPGKVIGQVVKMNSSHDKIPKGATILVTERTDPGWTPLFLHMKGILVERGSPLSHSAIVAREFGIPTIVGIKGLMSLVNSGDIVSIDGALGSIKIENDNEESPDE